MQSSSANASTREQASHGPKESAASLREKVVRMQLELEAAEAREQQAHARKQNRGQDILVAQSPSPKKPRSEPEVKPQSGRQRLDFSQPPVASSSRTRDPVKEEVTQDLLQPVHKERPSSFLKDMAKAQKSLQTANERRDIKKATSFSAPATAVACQPKEDPEEYDGGGDRDDSLRIIENLQPGPHEFKPPQDDPHFDQMEPYSRIRLKAGSRSLSHDQLQDYLDARYHLSPSRLYSIIRPGRGNEMEVPVDADYVVIGVLAEKSDIKMTAPKQQQPQHASTKGKRKAKATAEEGLPAEAKVDNQLNGDAVDDQIDDEDPDRPHQQTQRKKRYIMFKLLDMRLRRDGLSSAGDSMLNLIMFEADSSRETINAESDDELVNEQTGARMKKAERQSKKTQNRCYKGGSRGAYEKFWKEPNGTVIAVLNPKVLKPRPQPGQQQQSNILTITPETADSIVVIGRSRDLGTCGAMRKDGQPCTAWCDKRISDACDFHVQNALQKTRSGRAELMTGTSSLTRDLGRGGKRGGLVRGGSGRGAGYDPINKTGLLPRDGRRQVDGVSTYVLAGNTSSSGSKRPRPGQPGGGFAMPSEQRNKEDVAERKRRREAEEKMLSRVLKKDDNRSMGARYLNRNKPPTNSTSTDSEEGDSAGNDADSKKKSRKRAFDATQLRAIGYDPTNRTDTLVHLGEDAKTKKQRMETVSSLGSHGPGYTPKLGHAPDYKRSNVSDPTKGATAQTKAARIEDDDDDDDLVVLPADN